MANDYGYLIYDAYFIAKVEDADGKEYEVAVISMNLQSAAALAEKATTYPYRVVAIRKCTMETYIDKGLFKS